MKKKRAVWPLLAFALLASPLSAHVVVKPSQVGVGAYQTFVVGVPNERDNPTVSLRLVLPPGLNEVSPNVKAGWTVEVKTEGTGKDAHATEILWTRGSIPAGFRDDFFFSAQAPAKAGLLTWKAYQTYKSGEVVNWDQEGEEKPGMDDDKPETMGPASKTKVVDDLTPASSAGSAVSTSTPSSSDDSVPLILSIIAVILAAAALLFVVLRRKN